MPEFEMTPPPRNTQNRRDQDKAPVSQVIDYTPRRRPEYQRTPAITPLVRQKSRKSFWQRLQERLAQWFPARSQAETKQKDNRPKSQSGSDLPVSGKQGSGQRARPPGGPQAEKSGPKPGNPPRRSGPNGQQRTPGQNQAQPKQNRPPSGQRPSSPPRSEGRPAQSSPRQPSPPQQRPAQNRSGPPPSRPQSPAQNSQRPRNRPRSN